MSLEQTIDRVLNARMPQQDGLSSEEMISRWQGDVEALYQLVQEWMKPYIDAEKVAVERQPIKITEENLGTYTIDMLDFDVGDETIRLQPRATRVIGASGRVDMIRLGSTDDPVLLVLTGENHSRAWSIVEAAVRTKLKPLTKPTFEGAVERLFREFSFDMGPKS